MNSIAIIRSDNKNKVNTALCDLVRYAHISFSDKPRMLDPKFADEILTSVMEMPLKNSCDAAAAVPIREDASTAINRLRKIHPPAHIIIVSPKYKHYNEVAGKITKLPEIDLTVDLSRSLSKKK
jgi:hypothetical protein